MSKIACGGILSVLLSLLFIITGCNSPESTPPASYSVQNDQIIVPDDSPFRKHLEVIKAKAPEHNDVVFNTVGQIIALANSSSALSGTQLSWVELDPTLSAMVGIHLKLFSAAPIGTALGLTTIPSEYKEQIHAGEIVDISRYGLKKSDVHASIIRIEPRPGDKNSSFVVFRINKGQAWYPGTNCEVKFPLLHMQTTTVPTTGILHEGYREFVLKEASPGHFKVQPIFIVDETPASAQIIGLKNGDSLIGSGAILLKPELHNFIQQQSDLGHVTQ
jgi:hypothetical protein